MCDLDLRSKKFCLYNFHALPSATACSGDSGGPLMIRSPNLAWTIIGIVSTGPAQCGLTPVIYHNVLSSIHWIRDTIATSSPR